MIVSCRGYGEIDTYRRFISIDIQAIVQNTAKGSILACEMTYEAFPWPFLR